MKIFIRLDDSHERQNYDNWTKVLNILKAKNIVPLVAIIPDNLDESLNYSHADLEFYQSWLDTYRDSIVPALHGLNHSYRDEKHSIYKGRSTGEFGGYSEEIQYEMMVKGLSFMRDKFRIDHVEWFVAPGHSFNFNTVKVCARLGFNISDGISTVPFINRSTGVKFIPQVINMPKKVWFNCNTVCLHPNTMTDDDFLYLNSLITSRHKHFASWTSTHKYFRIYGFTLLLNWFYLNVRNTF
jgi:hypothetical protein